MGKEVQRKSGDEEEPARGGSFGSDGLTGTPGQANSPMQEDQELAHHPPTKRNQRLSAELTHLKRQKAELERQLLKLVSPPWHPAQVLAAWPNSRLEVVAGGQRLVVEAAEEIDIERLQPGDEVLLNGNRGMVIGLTPQRNQTGMVGTVSEIEGDRPIVRGVSGEQLALLCRQELAVRLRPGDRVLYQPGTHCVVARFPGKSESSYELRKPPRVTFADIGGFGNIIDQLKAELAPHFGQPEVAARYKLNLLRGIVLVGPPGVGKTILAGALTRYIAERQPGTKLLNVQPGALRSVYYGQTEERIRELFATARGTKGLAVIFFDEVDSFGIRGTGIGQDVDSRVLGAILAEIDGLDRADNVLCIAATNRLDLCDEALVRAGRLGSKIFHLGRPDRQGAEDILSRYLPPSLPYRKGGDHGTLIQAAASYLYSVSSGAGTLAAVTLSSGERRPIRAPDLMSGALIANAVERAKRLAISRESAGQGGLAENDLLKAFDEVLASEAKKLESPGMAARTLDFPGAREIVRVEVTAPGHPAHHQYVRPIQMAN